MNNKTPDRAWKLLSKRGSWIKGDFHRFDGVRERFCALGAINHVYGSESAIQERVTKFRSNVGGSVADWNDKTPGLTRKQVVAKLKRFGI